MEAAEDVASPGAKQQTASAAYGLQPVDSGAARPSLRGKSSRGFGYYASFIREGFATKGEGATF